MNLQSTKPIVIYEDIPEAEVLSLLKETSSRHNPMIVAFSVIALIVLLFIGVRVAVRVLKLMA